MMQQSQELKEVKDAFEKWRTTRIKKEPVPEHLWLSALKLLNNHSLSGVSKNLGLSFHQLKHFPWLCAQINQQNLFCRKDTQ